jgi:hypothetical protein
MTRMKYCFNCNTITAGEPLFCDSCGASYDVKLCPRMHPNRRSAEACSQCGSRDLSTPQPKVPLWAKALLRLVPILFAGLLGIVSFAFLADFLQSLRNHPDVAFVLAVSIGFLWWCWSQIPRSIRQFIYRLIKRRDSNEKR